MKLYRTLLHLYPAAFRVEYGDEMSEVFNERRRRASNLPGRVALWLGIVVDVLSNALAAHADLFRQDLRYTARTIRRAPGFAFTVVLVAGLGVGATTAVFTIADHVLLRQLPFADPERLVKLWQGQPGYRMELSPPNYRDWKSTSTSFEAMGAYRGLSVNLVGQGDPRRLDGAVVTADLFPMLGVRPVAGRLFTPEDDREGAPATLLLSHRIWQSDFGGDPAVLGRRVLLDNAPHVIIGIMPHDFYFPNREAAIWTPMRFADRDFQDRNNNFLHVVAKLKQDISLTQAREEMRLIAKRLEQTYPKENEKVGAVVNLLRNEVSGNARMLVIALFGAALCVLLIACTNLANLLLARALARQRELAVRTSLGAGRERIVRQLLTESLCLAILGGAVGVMAASAALPLLMKLVPQSIPMADPSIDLRVLLFALLLTGLTGVGFGIIPALRACRIAGSAGLREGSRAGVGGQKERLRGALVIAEVTISVVLLIGTGLLIRALWHLQSVDPGFRPESVLTLRTSLPMPKYERVAQREQFYTRILSEIRELPGVSSAAYTSFLPIAMRGGIWPVSIGGQTQNRTEGHTASLRFVTPGFFATMGIPFRLGRDVGESDTRESLAVAVVSESFVRRYWPGENPLGRHFQFAFQERTIVGVVDDIRVRGLESASEPQVYLPHKQVPDGGIVWYAPKDLVIRSSAEAGALLPTIRRIIASADPEQPISDVRMLSDIVAADTSPRLIQVRVLGAFAAVAFLLAGIGIHGLLSFTVSNRAQEIAVRIALGAQSRNILTMIMRESILLATGGVVLGAALGYMAARAMESLLVGVTPDDAMTFGAAVGLTFVMTMAGSLMPALRAIRTDPARVIRAE